MANTMCSKMGVAMMGVALTRTGRAEALQSVVASTTPENTFAPTIINKISQTLARRWLSDGWAMVRRWLGDS